MLPDEQSDAERELAPDAPTTEPSAELKKQFWILVVVFNGALIATSLGVLLAALDGRPIIGASLAFLGLGTFYFGYQRYHRIKADDELFETNAE